MRSVRTIDANGLRSQKGLPQFGWARHIRTAAQTMNVTYYVVVPFDWDDAGALSAGQPLEASNAFAAERGARAIAHQHAGVVVFSRTGNPGIGEFQDAVILAQFGDVDLNALCE
jgi:hypothetical protein